MRHLPLSLAILLFPAVPALAQVTVDLRALDGLPHLAGPHLPGPHPPGAPPHRSIAGPPPPSSPVVSRPAAPAGMTAAAGGPSSAPVAPAAVAAASPAAPIAPAAPTPPAVPAGPAPPPASFAAAAPPVAAIPPVQTPPPAANAPPLVPPPIAASAATTAAATPAGLRLTFSKDQSDLSPDSAASIKQLVQNAPQTDTVSYNVLAYASGDPDDPSVARRLSLARAIAVRAALMAYGVPSTRIYLRALGSQSGGGGPPDRVAIDVLGANVTAGQR